VFLDEAKKGDELCSFRNKKFLNVSSNTFF